MYIFCQVTPCKSSFLFTLQVICYKKGAYLHTILIIILGLETSNQGPKRQDSYQQAIGLNSKIYIVNKLLQDINVEKIPRYVMIIDYDLVF